MLRPGRSTIGTASQRRGASAICCSFPVSSSDAVGENRPDDRLRPEAITAHPEAETLRVQVRNVTGSAA